MKMLVLMIVFVVYSTLSVDAIPSPAQAVNCPYVANPLNPDEYGTILGGVFRKINTCGGGTWSAAACTCFPNTTDCVRNSCRLYINFNHNMKDQSCHRATIRNSRPKVRIGDGMVGNGGSFSGIKTGINGAHLLIESLDGALGRCGSGGVQQLTVSTWIKYAGDPRYQGLVTNCNNADGPSFYLALEDGRVLAGVKTYDHPMVELSSSISTVLMQSNRWYYVVLVYDDPTVTLYIHTMIEFFHCATQQRCPTAATASQSGCVESGTCGLSIGKSWRSNEFFVGSMDNVQVAFRADYLACFTV